MRLVGPKSWLAALCMIAVLPACSADKPAQQGISGSSQPAAAEQGSPTIPGGPEADVLGARSSAAPRAVIDGSRPTPRTDFSGAPDQPTVTGAGPSDSHWELKVWDSAEAGKCGSIAIFRSSGGGGGGGGCGWDPRFDQNSFKGGPARGAKIRAAYGPVSKSAVRVELIAVDGERTEAMIVHDGPDGTRYYVAFPSPAKKLAKGLAYDDAGAVIAEYRNSPAEEAAFVARL